MSDLIDRQVAIEAIARRDTTDGTVKVFGGREVVEILKSLPSAQPELEKKIKEIGYTGKEGRIYIGGRLFAVRELAQ